jgi:transmembrane sensor
LEEQEIYLLITRYLSNQTTTTESEQLADWIALSLANEQTFEEIKIVWQASYKKTDAHLPLALSVLKEKMRAAENTSVVKKRIFNMNRYAVAASVTAAFFAFAFLLYRYTTNTDTLLLTQITKAGQKKTIVLTDGTKIYLAPQSVLKYPAEFADGRRVVELQGQAYFEVSKNPHRPFVVHTEKLDVQVLGTHFNVNSYKNQNSTAVSLLEGKVKISIPDDNAPNEYFLEPGEELSLNHINHQIYQYALDSIAAKGWMTNTLIFKDIKLADAAKKIEQMYGVKVVFANQATADTRLYATFKNDSLKNVLQTIAAIGNINYQTKDNKVYLTLKK